MQVIVAESAGFCFGVERAVKMVYEAADSRKDGVYTFGPIIHNEEVVGDLEARGVKVIHTEEELASLTLGCVVIRSHGERRDVLVTFSVVCEDIVNLSVRQKDPSDRTGKIRRGL